MVACIRPFLYIWYRIDIVVGYCCYLHAFCISVKRREAAHETTVENCCHLFKILDSGCSQTDFGGSTVEQNNVFLLF